VRLDLNLLIVLDVVRSEGSVTQAARRLNLAQPTVSNALARFKRACRQSAARAVRTNDEAHAQARDLVQPVREALAKVEAVLQGDERFEPKTAGRLIRVVASDHIGAVLLPKLTANLATHAEAESHCRDAAKDFPLHVRAANEGAAPRAS
jgi:DNA-binding transcriptional LysR family regulator